MNNQAYGKPLIEYLNGYRGHTRFQRVATMIENCTELVRSNQDKNYRDKLTKEVVDSVKIALTLAANCNNLGQIKRLRMAADKFYEEMGSKMPDEVVQLPQTFNEKQEEEQFNLKVHSKELELKR